MKRYNNIFVCFKLAIQDVGYLSTTAMYNGVYMAKIKKG